MLPKAHFATVYAKLSGKPTVETYVTEVSQDTWIYFPWDLDLSYSTPNFWKKRRLTALPNKSLLVVLFTIMINMMGVGLVWPTLPLLVEELSGGTISQTAAIYGATAVIFSLMQFIFAPIMGALSDRYGRRPVMLIALMALGFDNIFLALALLLAGCFLDVH